MDIHRVWERGETIPFPKIHFVRGDLQIVQSGDLFYVGVETRKEMHGGYVPSMLIESEPFFTFGEAMGQLEQMEDSKAAHCKQFNCE